MKLAAEAFNFLECLYCTSTMATSCRQLVSDYETTVQGVIGTSLDDSLLSESNL